MSGKSMCSDIRYGTGESLEKRKVVFVCLLPPLSFPNLEVRESFYNHFFAAFTTLEALEIPPDIDFG